MNYENSSEQRWFIKSRNTIYYILGVIEVFLALRLVFKLLGASTSSTFVLFLYSSTRFLIYPFIGIFKAFSTGKSYVFEPATVIAMIIYALVARGIVSLIKLKAVST
jgi:hypothetical protein